MKALAAAVTEQMLGVSAEIDNVLIYSRIDYLPEELIDILAYDMHVDWYNYSYPLEIKRNILKSSVKVHKKMGTKYAVEKALEALYPKSKVEEWFEYGGRPYTFRVRVMVGDWGLPEETAVQLIKKMWFYKNLRSHCDCIFYTLNAKKATIRAAPYLVLGEVLKVKAQPEASLQSVGKKVASANVISLVQLKVKAYTEKSLCGTAKRVTAMYVTESGNIKIKAVQKRNMGSYGKIISSAGATVAGTLVIKSRE